MEELNRNFEKKIRDLEVLLENQKVQGKNKIVEVIRNFDNEKDKIIHQYDIKREKYEF